MTINRRAEDFKITYITVLKKNFGHKFKINFIAQAKFLAF